MPKKQPSEMKYTHLWYTCMYYSNWSCLDYETFVTKKKMRTVVAVVYTAIM